MAMKFPNDTAFFQQVNAACHTAKPVYECFEGHDKEFMVLTKFPKP